jgi:hypothetical protein
MSSRNIFTILFSSIIILTAGTAWAQHDPYPYGTIAYYNTISCPTGWETYNDAAGYFLVPMPAGSGIGAKVGTALTDQEDRKHEHTLTATISIPSVEYALSTKCMAGIMCRKMGKDGTKTLTGKTDEASSNTPYVQLLVCIKTESTATADPIPQRIAPFFGGDACPDRWIRTLSTSGRFLVGLPADGQPLAAFGGDPLSPREDRTHTHSYSGKIKIDDKGVEGASGCCAKGYGAAGSYEYKGTTAPVSTALPYIQVSQCQPE